MYYAHFSSYFAALKFIYFRLTIQSKLIVKRIEMGGGIISVVLISRFSLFSVIASPYITSTRDFNSTDVFFSLV